MRLKLLLCLIVAFAFVLGVVFEIRITINRSLKDRPPIMYNLISSNLIILNKQMCSDAKIYALQTALAIHERGEPRFRGENPKLLAAMARNQLDLCWR